MPVNYRLQRPIVGSQGGDGEISSCCRCAIQGFQEEGAVQVFCRHSEHVSEQRASALSHASLPDSVTTESEEERATREQDEIDALDAVGD